MTTLLSVCGSLHWVKSTGDVPLETKALFLQSFLLCFIYRYSFSTCFTFAGYTRHAPNLGNTPKPLSQCVLCSCTGRSRDCHPENGTCYNCRTGSEGEHCERCQPGVDNSTDCKRCIPGFFGLTPSSGGCKGNGKFLLSVYDLI